jgi:cytidylate kinase
VFAGVVALDGPSGTGKSTVARRLAARLSARYLDTGAMYRAATLAVLRAGVALDRPDDIAAVARGLDLEIGVDPAHPFVRIDGADVSAEIRGADVTAAVSAVSAVPEVRAVMVARQRALIGSGGIVVEGRDIGSVVWPQARPKVYLTASAQVRAERRAGELGAGVDVAAVAADIERRDRLDSSRAASPLRRADDAIELDTTGLDIDAVVDELVAMTTSIQSDA